MMRTPTGSIIAVALCLYNTAAIAQPLQLTQPQLIAQQSPEEEADANYKRGLELFQQRTAESLKAAIPYFEKTATLYEQIGDKAKQALALLGLGTVHNLLEEKQKALDYYDQALPLFQAVGDRSGEATTLNGIGAVYYALGENQKALDYLDQALPLLQEASDHRREEAVTLNNIGLVYHDLGEKQKALDYYNQALPLSQAVGDSTLEAQILDNISSLQLTPPQLQPQQSPEEKADANLKRAIELFQQGTAESLRAAIPYFEKAATLYEQIGNQNGQTTALLGQGRVYHDLGENQKALNYLDQALALSQAVGDRRGEARTLNNIGLVYYALGENQKALEYYNQSLSQVVGDRRGEAITLNNIGLVYHDLGENQKALEYYNQALPLSQAVGDSTLEAQILDNISSLQLTPPQLQPQQSPKEEAEASFDKGYELYQQRTAASLQTAIPYLEKAATLYEQIDNKANQAAVLLLLGQVYSDLGEKKIALDYYNQALSLFQTVGDSPEERLRQREHEAVTLNSIALVYNDLGEKQKALDYYNQALPILQAVGDRSNEATILNNSGGVYNELGEYQKALDYYNQALPILQAVGDRSNEARTLNNIGLVYNDLGEYQKALDYLNQALPLSQAVGDRTQEATTLHNIGGVYSSLGEKQLALDYLNQALPLRRAVGDLRREAVTLHNIGRVYSDLGENQKALDYYNQAFPLFQAVGGRRGEAMTLTSIAAIYSDSGEQQQALDYYNQALPLSQVVGDRGGEATILNNIARAKARSGNLTAALTDIQAAIEIVEDLRSKIGSQELRASYFATVQGYYKLYINILMQLHQQNPDEGYDAQALHISERSRARSLVELLTEANANIRQGVDPQLLEKEQNLIQQLNGVEQARHELVSGQYNEAELEELKQESKSLLSQLDQLEAEIRLNSPGYANLKYPQPLTLAEIQQQVLDEETVLLSYSLGEERSYLWAVTTDSINSYELPSQEEIEAAAEIFRKSVTSDSGGSIEAGIALSEMLLSPVLDQLENKRLLIVGDGVLQYVPFAALPVTSPPAPLLQGEGSLTLDNASLLSGGTEGGFSQVRSQDSSPLSGGSKGGLTGDSTSPPAPLLQGEGSLTLDNASLLSGGTEGGFSDNSTSPPAPLLQGEGSLTPDNASLLSGGTEGGYIPLLVQNEIVTLSSASTVAIQRQQLQNRSPVAKKLAVLADPVFSENDERFTGIASNTDNSLSRSAMTRAARNLGLGDSGQLFDRLKYTRTEAEKILALVPENQQMKAFDFEASRTMATNPNLADYQIVHLATHGLLDPVNPELSGVVLSLLDENGETQNGFLRLNDIFNLNLPAELVVLSACETGLGENIRGEGLVGLTRGFMYAGARRVVVSLWAVNDLATSEVMARFYQKMLDENVHPVVALREAQLEMWNSENWRSPYYWAAFTIQGDWQN